jgi:hypothetical protein
MAVVGVYEKWNAKNFWVGAVNNEDLNANATQ